MNKRISIYRDVSDTVGSTCDMLSFLTTDKWKELSDAVRNEPDKDKRKELKKHLPCATLSGIFNGRGKNNLIEHSGFIALDIDADDNPLITDWDEFVQQLGNIDEVYFAGKSVSGQGAFCLIPIKYTDKHESHFDAIANDFAAIGIHIDKQCRDVSRLRFYSYNERYYQNENPKVYDKLYEPPAEHITFYSGDGDKVSQLVNKLVAAGINLVHEYGDWFTVAAALEGVPNGRYYFHQLSRIDAQKYNPTECDKKFDYVKPDKGIGVGTLFHLAKQHGITIDGYQYERQYNRGERRNHITVIVTDKSDQTTNVDVAVTEGIPQNNEVRVIPKPVTPMVKKEMIPTRGQGQKWNDRISKVEEYVNEHEPSGSISLSKSTQIVDIEKFIDTHLSIVVAHNGNILFEPYLIRLEKFIELNKQK